MNNIIGVAMCDSLRTHKIKRQKDESIHQTEAEEISTIQRRRGGIDEEREGRKERLTDQGVCLSERNTEQYTFAPLL